MPLTNVGDSVPDDRTKLERFASAERSNGPSEEIVGDPLGVSEYSKKELSNKILSVFAIKRTVWVSVIALMFVEADCVGFNVDFGTLKFGTVVLVPE